MARGPKKKAISGEVIAPDFEHAAKIYTKDIAPANANQKRAMKEASDGWKEVKNEAHVHVAGFRTAVNVSKMEEAEQQAWLRAFRGGCDQFDIVLHADLADQAEGVNADTLDIVPTGEAPQTQLLDVD